MLRHSDQAEGLRRILGRQTPAVLSLVSGGSHAGKTQAAINIAIALAQAGRNVLLLDENRGFHNVAGALGLNPEVDLLDALSGRSGIERSLLAGPEGMMVLPAGRAAQVTENFGERGQARLREGFARIGAALDYILVDTLAGTTGRLLPSMDSDRQTLLVSGAWADAQADAYGMLKVLHRSRGRQPARLVVSMVRSEEEGVSVFRNIAGVADRYLGAKLEHLGSVAHDELVRKSGRVGRAAIEMFPDAPSSRHWRQQAEKLMEWPPFQQGTGQPFSEQKRVADRRSMPGSAVYSPV
ncbi:MAG: MinD/ParA family protein [Burkholderiales bacterium]